MLRYKKRFLYVGRTVDPVAREKAHRARKEPGCGSYYIPKHINWVFAVIDECHENDVERLERLYIDFYEPEYNQMRPRVKIHEYAAQPLTSTSDSEECDEKSL
jgi:hypothetical protein